MNEATDATYPIKQQSVDLLLSIAEADTRLKAIRLEYHAQALILDLEAHDRLSSIDSRNLDVVFRVALEKRLIELTRG
jgi:hypothetical protein